MTQAYTNRFTEVEELPVGWLTPDTRAAGVYTTGYISLANHQRASFILLVGDMAAGATVDLQLWEATDAAGTGAQAIVGKAITQLTQAGGDGDDAVIVELRTEELDVDAGYAFVAAIVTIAGGNVDSALLPLLGCSNYPPVSVANWTEIVD